MNRDIAINMDTSLEGVGIIELPMNCVVVISKGNAKLRELSDHDEFKIVNHQEKVRWIGGKREKNFEGNPRVLLKRLGCSNTSSIIPYIFRCKMEKFTKY